MKRLLIIAALAIVANAAAAQNYYGSIRRDVKPKNFTFQVVPQVVDYSGAKYGFGIGVNYKDILALNYFATRDYDFADSIKDNNYNGIHLNAVLPIGQVFDLGAGVRLGTSNGEIQKAMYSGEVRIRITESLKFGAEYGKRKGNSLTSLKLIWNIR